MPERSHPRPAHDVTDRAAFWFDEHNKPWRPARPRRGIHGTARLARRADLADLLDPPRDDRPRSELPLYAALVEASPDGAVLEPLVYRSLHLPEELRTRHILAIGQTGCGKTTRLIYPLLASDLMQKRTVIAFDAKGRKVLPLVERLAAVHRPGQKVQLLNFRDPARSARWSPLASIRTEGDAHEAAFKICTLVDRGSEREGAFWLNNSIDLLAGIFLALATNPKEKPSLARARQVAQLPFSELGKFAKENPRITLLSRVVELHGDAHATGACVLQDLRMRLSGFMDERIGAVTEPGEGQLDLDALILGGGVLVIEVNETDVARLRQVINLFMNHLFARLIALAADAPLGRLPHPVSLFLDEFASAVGRIDDMEVRLNTIRERGVSVTAAVQSLSQLGIYGSSAGQVLAGFASKVYFAGLEWADAEYASRQAGITTIYAPVEEEDEGEPWRTGGNRGVPVARSLLLPEEVARPVSHPAFGPPATLFLADRPPLLAYLRPAWDLPLLSRILEPDLPAPPTDPEEALKRRVEQLRHKYQVDQAGAAARAWWQEHEQGRPLQELPALLGLLEPLHAAWRQLREPRPVFLDAVERGAGQSGARQLEAQLSFARYQLLRRHEEEQLGLEPERR